MDMNVRYRARFAGSDRAAVGVRAELRAFAQQFAFTPAELADLECAVGEALANAVEHGRGTDGVVDVQASFESDALVITVHDTGPGFVPPARLDTPPPAEAPRGFGMYIMRSFVDELSFEDGGRLVRLVKRLPPPREGSAEVSC